MNKMAAIFVTLSMTLVFLTTDAKAATYFNQVMISYEGFADACGGIGGAFDGSNGICYRLSSIGDKIEFKQTNLNGKKIEIVEITMVNSGGTQKSFFGVVVRTLSDRVLAGEIDKDSGRPLPKGCVMSIFRSENVASAVPTGEFCDFEHSIMRAKQID